MAFVKKIKWIDESSKEAEVIISDNNLDLLCFSHPFSMSLNEDLLDPIYCYDTENVVASDVRIPFVKKKDNSYGYFLRGQLIDSKKKIVDLGTIHLDLSDEDIPKDIKVGEYIEFDVSRLNIY